MTDDTPYDGVLFELWSEDVNAPNGRRKRHIYCIANGPMDVSPAWREIDRGAHVLAAARALGVADGDCKIVEC